MSAVNAKTGAGAGVGAAIGFFLGGGPLGAGIGAVLGGLVANRMNGAPKGEMTAQRKLAYERAMQSIKSPQDLKTLADSFAGEGLHAEAAMLRKRASLRELSPEVAEQRRDALRRGMASDNPAAIRELASQFAAVGSTDAAKTLLAHAAAVEAARAAGASLRPVGMKTLESFADKLAKAIGHFGADSRQAATAARNLILAQGKVASKEAIAELLDVAQGTLADDAQATAPAASAPADPTAPPPVADPTAAPPVAAAASPASAPAAAAPDATVEPPARVRVDVDEPEAEEIHASAAGAGAMGEAR